MVIEVLKLSHQDNTVSVQRILQEDGHQGLLADLKMS